MRLPQMGHCVLSAVVLCTAFGSLGCPKLNRWSGPSQDPFFSVADRVAPGQHEPPVRESQTKLKSKVAKVVDEAATESLVNPDTETLVDPDADIEADAEEFGEETEP